MYASSLKNAKTYYVNSAMALSGIDENFTYEINTQNSPPVNRIAMIACQIPKSYYVINSGRNTFSLSENGSAALITIPPGNYSLISMQKALPTLLNAASPNHWVYTANYNASNIVQDGKWHFAVTGNSSQPSFITTNCYEPLGLPINSTTTFVGSALISPNVIKLIAEDTLYWRSDIVECSAGQPNVLQAIFVSGVQDFANVNWTCPELKQCAKVMARSTANAFNFTLVDEFDNLIPLNGLNTNFILQTWWEDETQEPNTTDIKSASSAAAIPISTEPPKPSAYGVSRFFRDKHIIPGGISYFPDGSDPVPEVHGPGGDIIPEADVIPEFSPREEIDYSESKESKE